MVEWISGCAAGKRSLVKRSSVKEGNIAAGVKVKLSWGKSKKLFEAVIVGSDMSPSIPVQSSKRSHPSATTEENFTFELASPASIRQESPELFSPVKQNSDGFRFDDFMRAFTNLEDAITAVKDATDGAYAKIIIRVDRLEKTIAELICERLSANLLKFHSRPCKTCSISHFSTLL